MDGDFDMGEGKGGVDEEEKDSALRRRLLKTGAALYMEANFTIIRNHNQENEAKMNRNGRKHFTFCKICVSIILAFWCGGIWNAKKCVCSSGDRAMPSGGMCGGSIPFRRVACERTIPGEVPSFFAISGNGVS